MISKNTITARVADWGDDGGVIFTQVSCPPDDFSDEDAFTLNFEAKPSETADTFLRIFVDPDAPTIGDGYDIKLNFGSLAYKSKVSKTDLADDVPPKALTVTLAASGWADNQITVAAEGVTASSLVDVSPAPSSVTDPAANNLYAYAAAMIQCVAQGSGTLTFMCQTTPTIDLVANIVILR